MSSGWRSLEPSSKHHQFTSLFTSTWYLTTELLNKDLHSQLWCRTVSSNIISVLCKLTQTRSPPHLGTMFHSLLMYDVYICFSQEYLCEYIIWLEILRTFFQIRSIQLHHSLLSLETYLNS